jgi:hypothetical protein
MNLPVPTANAVTIAQTYGSWIQTGAICLSAIAAFFLILWTQRIACRRATLDLIMHQESDLGQIKERRSFIDLRDKGNLLQYAALDKASSVEAASIRATLNRYELVAIGISRKTLDAKLYLRWCRTTLAKDWIACKPFVMQLRQNGGRNTFYCEFETLARKWAEKAEKTQI